MSKRIKDPGIGRSSNNIAKRFINHDGSFSVKHINKKPSLSESYNYLIRISWGQFFFWVFLGYVMVNALFALGYVLIGISSITVASGHFIIDFMHAFFFSAQTITTVGYGAMAPKSIASEMLSSFEALVGFISFSFITGLLYGRFSKPRASIRFSKSIVIREHQGVDCIMFRLMSNTRDVMINPKIEVTLALSTENDKGKFVNNFYGLNLERDQITYLPTTWTIVHPIDDSSPLYGFSTEKLKKMHGEMLILAKYYDESFAQELYQAHSYTLSELRENHKFIPAFYYDQLGYTILDHSKLGSTKEHYTSVND